MRKMPEHAGPSQMTSLFPGLKIDSEAARLLVEGFAFDAEGSSSLRFIALCLLQNPHDVLALHILERGRAVAENGFRGRVAFAACLPLHVGNSNLAGDAEDRQPFHEVLQLADIARPRHIGHHLYRLRGYADIAFVPSVRLLEEVLDQQWYVFAALG